MKENSVIWRISKEETSRDNHIKEAIWQRQVISFDYVIPHALQRSYSGMEQPYNEIFHWLGQNGYESTGVYDEYYYNSPAEVPEEELLTGIVMPVK